nr:MAG TPA: hypothetical protein [Crassvirales sp.]
MTISIQKIIQKSLQIDNNQYKDNPFENNIKEDN